MISPQTKVKMDSSWINANYSMVNGSGALNEGTWLLIKKWSNTRMSQMLSAHKIFMLRSLDLVWACGKEVLQMR